MKKIYKVLSVALIVIVLMLSDFMILTNCVRAEELQTLTLYNKTYCDKVLIYTNYAVGSTYVAYNKDGVEYPAYCLNPELAGIGEVEQYDVTVSEKIKDVGLWRILINGYPYKSIEELGVANEKEAYLATKQAIYCYIKNRGTSNYSANSEAGYRTLNALNKILNDARNSTELFPSNYCEIKEENTNWEHDLINKKYVSKTYEVKSETKIKEYKVKISGENIPEGIIVTDINNNEKEIFENNEKFKILIPIYNLNNEGIFNINLSADMYTKPILYGIAPNEKLQNYAVTAYEFENVNNVFNERYGTNKTKINILKQDKETKNPLANTEFQLLDETKNVIYMNLITDNNGKVEIKDLIPGTYYLKETKPLDGYISYDDLIEIKISLNEIVDIVVNNSKEKIIEISNEYTQIEISQDKVINKLPITGM